MPGRILPWLAHAGLLAWNASELARHLDQYRVDTFDLVLLGARTVGLACAIVISVHALLRSPGARVGARYTVRLVACPGAALLLATLAQPAIGDAEARWLTRSIFFAGLAITQALWALFAPVDRTGGAGRPGEGELARIGWPDVVVVNLLVSVVLLEGITTLWATLRPSPLLSGPELPARIAAVRDQPGRLHFGTPLNSGGYADDEFFAAGPDDLAVAVLADSFGIGVVPQRYNFVSVAEETLEAAVGDRYARLALHDFGLPGVGLNVYRYVYETQALPLRPSLVVVCVFVGNDILEGYTFGTTLAERYRLQEWYVWNVARKLFVLARSPTEEIDAVASIGRSEPRFAPFPPAVDPSLESPTHSWPVYREIELRRMEVANPASPRVERRFRHFFRGLEYFHDQLGERLLIAVLPDEFQVNDDLYASLVGYRPEVAAYPRSRPQERILAFCEQRGAHCLDLLPVLRAAEPDGRTYHLRDSHFNARGNRVAGEALARAIEEILDRDAR